METFAVQIETGRKSLKPWRVKEDKTLLFGHLHRNWDIYLEDPNLTGHGNLCLQINSQLKEELQARMMLASTTQLIGER